MRANADTVAFAPTWRSHRYQADLIVITLLALSVSIIYGARLSVLPIVGEETRWATGAREMLATGDWIVPRQQGYVFPERPPMTMWMMAVAGWLRGDVDAIAIRLPSVIAIVLTTLLIYTYVRTFASVFAATTAGLAYSTFGQVLQIGRQGESEAVFALLVGASLLVWHLGYMRSWPRLIVWSSGFALAGLAALVKGPQAPVYFVAITAAYLIITRRGWRYLINWQYAVGFATFITVVAAWQFPFYLATDWSTVVATWSGLAADRIHFNGVLTHAVTYPLETFVCLLPWSPILFALIKRETRSWVGDWQQVIVFLTTALLVTYPTVWLAAGARGRYFMPLYPLIAVLIGLVIERCSMATRGSYPRQAWHQFLLLWGTIIATSALVVASSSLLHGDISHRLDQPSWFAIVFGLLAIGAVSCLWFVYRPPDKFQTVAAVIAIAAIAGISTTGLMVNVNAARWNDPTAVVAGFKNQIPPGAKLVSLSPIDHRFAYYFKEPITELAWPRKVEDLPAGIDYFCFMWQPGDTAESRAAGRGRSWYTTPGTLPVAWREIDSICVDRVTNNDAARYVILGRVERPLRAVTTDVTVRQHSIVQRIATMRPN